MKRKILLLTLAIPVILCQQAMAQSRLVAQSHWASNGTSFTPVDSSSFNYSSARGGDLKHTLDYDNSYTWTYDTAYENAYYYIQTFDANNNITSQTTQIWNGTGWVNYSKTLYTYNSSNQKTTMILQSWNGTSWAPVSQDVYGYNVAGLLVTDLYEQWDGLTSTFDNTTLRTYFYDALNNRVNETDQNFVGGSPIYTNQWAYTYSSINQVLTITYSTWNGSGWTPNTMTTNSYDTVGDEISQLQQTYNTGSSSWVNNTLDIYSGFNSAMEPAMDIHQTWNSSGSGMWVNNMEDNFTYNSNNQLTTSTGKSWNIVGVFEYQLGDPMANYYYGPYSTVTSVKNVSNTAGDAKVYPVPAQSTLNVDLNWNDAQTANITLYTAQGNIVRQWSTPNSARFHSAVSVDNLSDGMYFLNITGAQGQIVKQIVIAH